MKNSKKQQMDERQVAAFLTYYGLGAERSLDKLWRDWGKIVVNFKRPKSTTTIENWSKKFHWQNKIAEMDEEANKKLFDEAVGEARKTRVDIMKIFRVVVLRYASQIRNQPNKEIGSFDVEKFWRMARVEMGLPTDRSALEHELGGNLAEIIKSELEEREKHAKSRRRNKKRS